MKYQFQKENVTYYLNKKYFIDDLHVYYAEKCSLLPQYI